MTDSQLPATQSPSSSQCATLTRTPLSESYLRPASAKQGSAELLACLTLVAPTGMTGEERSQWLAVARETLSGIPADLLTYGCKQARAKCRFPSDIVPTIMAEVGDSWRQRERIAANAAAREAARNAPPRIEHKEPPVAAEQAAAILAEFGLKRTYSASVGE